MDSVFAGSIYNGRHRDGQFTIGEKQWRFHSHVMGKSDQESTVQLLSHFYGMLQLHKGHNGTH